MILNYNNFINESQYYSETLCSKFWDEDNNFNNRIRNKLLTIANEFYDDISMENKPEIIDIQLTGSLANYNWNNNSDFDLHILIDFKEVNSDTDLVKMAMDNHKNQWNLKHNIMIQGHDVEVYIQDKDEPHQSSGLYSLLNDEWVKEPKFEDHEIDEMDIEKKYEAYVIFIDKLDEISNKEDISMEEVESYYKYANKLKSKIMSDRKEGLKTKESEYSVENLVFKKLRNSGHMEKLFDLINKLYDMQYAQ